ncbi:DUF485 domain-containing protein [Micrococcus flavus]|uniref:Uncharacterized membrane protein (DUF485 family) n=1 Tax=Micrococcus flavus TaxID=384602 RepID=A0A4Y8X503_9MICC|nr:DUF485 domain-containing protein [Micrococcus flavus]MBB4883156.1 uncharacterized membrane protein (DUF485 family) [Micrococcus flavus]TFI04560.1 DUF485 domain-containing protein [Micrococcus flavus]GGK42841.1 membrane protein [Micrococcus flavus]
MSSTEHAPPSSPTAEQFRAAQRSEEFGELRRTHRSFAFPMTVAFFVWYLLFVIMGAFFPQVMAIRVYDNITLGLVLGLLQFVTTFAITFAYVRFSNRVLDPRATALRERLEREAVTGPETPEATR